MAKNHPSDQQTETTLIDKSRRTPAQVVRSLQTERYVVRCYYLWGGPIASNQERDQR